MAAPMAMPQVAMPPDTLIVIKLQVGDENRRFKLPLRDLGANILPDKVSRHLGSLVQSGSDSYLRADGYQIYHAEYFWGLD